MGTRYTAGRLNGVHAEPGTLLGPKDITCEWMVVLDNDDSGCTVGYATADEITAASQRLATCGPQSLAELALMRRAGQ